MKMAVCGLGAVVCVTGWAQEARIDHRGDRPSVERSIESDSEMRPHSWLRGDRGAQPQAGSAPGFFFPADITSAYGITPSMGGGTGVTIAVVDAYDSPNAEADLAVFSS